MENKLSIFDYLISSLKSKIVKTILIILGFIILAIIYYDDFIDNSLKIFRDIYYEKFKDDNKFHILILSFDKIYESNEGIINIEVALSKRFDELNEFRKNEIVYIIDKNKIPSSVEEAKKIGKSRKSDIVIWGEYYKNKESYNDDIRIRWVLIEDLSTHLGINGDSKIQPIERLAEISDGYLLYDIEYLFYWNLGIKYFKKTNYKKALNNFLKLTNLYKNISNKEANLYHAIGLCYDYLNEYRKALEFYKKTFEIDSNCSYAYNNYAIKLAWNFSQYDSAKTYLLKALEKSRYNSIVISNYAWLLQEHYKDLNNAIYYYKLAIEKDKKDVLSYYNLAFIYDYYYNDNETAIFYYKKTIEINPKSSFLVEQYAIFLGRKLNQYNTAIKYHKKAISLDSNYASPLNSLAHIALINNDLKSAVIYFEKSIKIDPNFAEPYTVYGMILCEYYNDIYKGKEYLIKSVDLFEKQQNETFNLFMAYNNLALFYSKYEKDYNKAEKLFLKAIKVDSNAIPPLTNLLYLYYFKMKDFNKASKCFKALQSKDKVYREITMVELMRQIEELKRLSGKSDSLVFYDEKYNK